MSDKKEDTDVMDLGPGCQTHGMPFMRHREGRVETGTAVMIRDGQPIPNGCSEVVTLERRSDGRYRVTSLMGPPKVNSKAYKRGWDGVFGKPVVGQA